jgi:site-specific recombinase XerD
MQIETGVGLKLLRFHDLRHTFASLFMMGGGNIYTLQKLLGHASVQMTERYSHLSPEHLKGATDFLNLGVDSPGKIVRLVGNGA